MLRNAVSILALLLALVLLLLVVPPSSSFQLKEVMTAAEFERCGLQKLTRSELATLEGWISRRAGQSPEETVRPKPVDPVEVPLGLPNGTDAGATKKSDLVMFNQSSKKYHCPSCRWAKECTRNCVEITRAEALRLGGVACKTCKGRCAE
ncbi:MAG TPA: hypothetical protein VEL74_14130 [Thermoanaerobaculia bacterium]|nr:hypothetical protein [Thermoanaerobaculia bacterium]